MNKAKEMLLARIHLGAVLPLLEDIAAFDPALREALVDWNFTVQFQLPGGKPATALVFKRGSLKTYPSGVKGARVSLTFKDAAFLNQVFQGRTKKSPRPGLTGLLHLKKLRQLEQVLGHLERYLKPVEELLQQEESYAFCVKIALYALAFGIKEVGEYDPELSCIAARLPDGVVEIGVVDGPAVHIRVKKGKFYPARGEAETANARLEIADLDTAWAMLQGKLDLFAAVGGGKIKLRGNIPLLDGISPLMDRLALYLAG
ncbi:hypothetical protein HKBW3S43_01337 [Candidatus Hakubella thermalkaliphila]|uniref:SCP2 domain-containing protein n=1 Tax=Candidatus Hakubella thermalkaliphila TaxID=2754717 RepID=A0A6V8P5U6_9ACTN|nr:hypothetical protein [Candidatus Hakubella thermalkaliphila]MBT9166721.1 hypothetical protein [Bacillota bacterium]MBT9174115.1 hypothetical protein [Bacillota bacterium]GFP25629.1 hypothetical protein HKBW3S25_01109 [Candidatus Hakubella thermalkaliphila]GFP26984.1 hypothetical protein HKBW3S33_00397 [Candidatus Hakubella thermalkaliphila]GFP35546.1 hypothetical protein HKBW3S43_01337 [Candidatus Hakubella thermalkaliphila]